MGAGKRQQSGTGQQRSGPATVASPPDRGAGHPAAGQHEPAERTRIGDHSNGKSADQSGRRQRRGEDPRRQASPTDGVHGHRPMIP
jgi:hypothetical protein